MDEGRNEPEPELKEWVENKTAKSKGEEVETNRKADEDPNEGDVPNGKILFITFKGLDENSLNSLKQEVLQKFDQPIPEQTAQKNSDWLFIELEQEENPMHPMQVKKQIEKRDSRIAAECYIFDYWKQWLLNRFLKSKLWKEGLYLSAFGKLWLEEYKTYVSELSEESDKQKQSLIEQAERMRKCKVRTTKIFVEKAGLIVRGQVGNEQIYTEVLKSTEAEKCAALDLLGSRITELQKALTDLQQLQAIDQDPNGKLLKRLEAIQEKLEATQVQLKGLLYPVRARRIQSFGHVFSRKELIQISLHLVLFLFISKETMNSEGSTYFLECVYMSALIIVLALFWNVCIATQFLESKADKKKAQEEVPLNADQQTTWMKAQVQVEDKPESADEARSFAKTEEKREDFKIDEGLQSFLKELQECENVERAIQLFENITKNSRSPATNTIAFNSLLHIYAKQGNVEEASRLFHEEGKNWSRTVVTYNIMFNAHEKRIRELQSRMQSSKEDIHAMKQLFGRMKKEGIKPTIKTYSTLMSACVKAGELASAKVWLKEMRDQDFKPNETSKNSRIAYNCFIKTCATAGKPKEAESFFHEMEENELTPDVITYNTLIDAYAHNNVDKAQEWFKKMKEESNISPTIVTYGTICKALSRHGRWEDVEGIVEQSLPQSGIEMNDRLYLAQLLAYANANPPQTEKAKTLFKNVHRTQQERVSNLRIDLMEPILCKVCGEAGARQFFDEICYRPKANTTAQDQFLL